MDISGTDKYATANALDITTFRYSSTSGLYSDAGVTPCVNNDLVYRWTDLYGRNYLQQTNATYRFTFKTGGSGGQNYITRTTSYGVMAMSGAPSPKGEDFCWTFVFHPLSVTNRYLTTSNANFYFHMANTGPAGRIGFSPNYSTVALTNDTPIIFTIKYSNRYGYVRMFRNGVQLGTDVATQGLPYPLIYPSLGSTGSTFYYGHVYEWIGHQFLLTDQQIADMHTALNSIYAIY